MREIITLACSDCKRRNYTITKNKKKHTDKFQIKKYCKFCKKHTLHKETK
jgi:large subunit ribosomal protein L33